MKGGPKSSLRPFLHRALQLLIILELYGYFLLITLYCKIIITPRSHEQK